MSRTGEIQLSAVTGPTTIQRGQMRKAPVMYSLATSRAAIILSWTDRGTKHTKEFDID